MRNKEEGLSLLLFLICRGLDGNLNVALLKDHDESPPEKRVFPKLTPILPRGHINSSSASEFLRKTALSILQEKYSYLCHENDLYPVRIQKSSSDASSDEIPESLGIEAFLVLLSECESLSVKENVQWVHLEEILNEPQYIEASHQRILEEVLSQYPREIFQAKYSNLKAHPGALQVMKLPVPVKVCFATSPGTLTTKEGPVTYATDDALLTGIEGESWPVQRLIFEETYEPMKGTLSGSEGLYVKKPIGVWAIQLDHSEEVWIGDGENRLLGKKGDWLVEYSGGRFGVVSQDIFKKTYQVLSETSE